MGIIKCHLYEKDYFLKNMFSSLLLHHSGRSPTTIAIQIVNGSDDAEENPKETGAVDLTSSALDMPRRLGNQQVVGLRFLALNIPQGATILTSYIQFSADSASADNLAMVDTIQAENVDSAAPFTTTAGSLTARAKTTATVAWTSVPQWVDVGDRLPAQQTPDISTVIQEVVNRAGWSTSSNLAIFISSAANLTNNRIAVSYDGNAAQAPTLHITYS